MSDRQTGGLVVLIERVAGYRDLLYDPEHWGSAERREWEFWDEIHVALTAQHAAAEAAFKAGLGAALSHAIPDEGTPSEHLDMIGLRLSKTPAQLWREHLEEIR